ncbi:Uncharacterised protein [Mycobacteroides abscessus subsp. massiliense]|nr:Uncharacterised protein [Mycobacteroides abscessus subsp. massiliense]
MSTNQVRTTTYAYIYGRVYVSRGSSFVRVR